ncbi:MAG: RNA polymerase sigma factor [Endomicrobiales bacterium]|nr:RNA polymerase sigma factor [Endomicrobiales bacterium]
MIEIPRETIVLASKGDINAFEDIYITYSGFIYNLCLRVMGNSEDAREVSQSVFIKIFKELKNFRFKSSFKTWLYRISVNESINARKKASRLRFHQAEYNDAIKNMNTAEGHKTFSNTEISSLIDSLNSDQKACLILREFEGLNYKEIAETLKININTVRSRLKRARESLISNYRKSGGDLK